MPERIPTPEFSDLELQLIQKLKESGPADAETKKLLNVWIDAEQPRPYEGHPSQANIEFNLKRAKLYAAAGFVENARENAEAAMLQAANEQEPDLWDEAKSFLDSLGK
jgi:hypothetical protein